jgi:hypothetical protein
LLLSDIPIPRLQNSTAELRKAEANGAEEAVLLLRPRLEKIFEAAKSTIKEEATCRKPTVRPKEKGDQVKI